jgi:hypothetical protein
MVLPFFVKTISVKGSWKGCLREGLNAKSMPSTVKSPLSIMTCLFRKQLTRFTVLLINLGVNCDGV